MNIGEKESDQPINLPIPVHPGEVPVEPAIEPIAEPIPAEAVPADAWAMIAGGFAIWTDEKPDNG